MSTMTPQDFALAILSQIYQQQVTIAGLDSGLPIIKEQYEWILSNLTVMVTDNVVAATSPYIAKLSTIKAQVAALAAEVSSE